LSSLASLKFFHAEPKRPTLEIKKKINITLTQKSTKSGLRIMPLITMKLKHRRPSPETSEKMKVLLGLMAAK